jgi:hypothetical protein
MWVQDVGATWYVPEGGVGKIGVSQRRHHEEDGMDEG